MLRLYAAPSNSSSQKAREWLTDHQISFKERNVAANPLTSSDIKKLLYISIDGTSNIISKKSRAYKVIRKRLDRENKSLDDLPLSKMISLMVKHPSLIRKPIIFNNKTMESGYNEEEIRKFLPKTIKTKELHHLEQSIDRQTY